MDTQDLIQKHRENFFFYEDLKDKVLNLLEQLLRKNKINYAFTQGRVKTVNSLIENLKKDKYKEISSLSDINDFLGCRIIFYLNQDLRNFERILKNEFEVLDAKDKRSLNEYQGKHYICSINEDRLKFSEYEDFKKIKFEIQLTTVLSYSWNELEHDIFYKSNPLIEKRYQGEYEKLKSQSRRIMEQHILPAQIAWEEILKNYQLVTNGISIYSKENLLKIAKIKSLDDMYYQLKNIFDNSSAVGVPEDIKVDKFYEVFLQIIQKAGANKVSKRLPDYFYNVPRNRYDVLHLIIDLSKQLYHRDFLRCIDFLIHIYLEFKDESIKTSIEDFFFEITNYNTDTLKEHGFIIQEEILKKYQNIKYEKRLEILKLIISSSRAIFQDKFYSNGWSFNDEKKAEAMTRTTHSFDLNDTSHFQIKEKYIKLLLRIFERTNNFNQKREIIYVLAQNLSFSSEKVVINFYLKQVKITKDFSIIYLIYYLLNLHKKEKEFKIVDNIIQGSDLYNDVMSLIKPRGISSGISREDLKIEVQDNKERLLGLYKTKSTYIKKILGIINKLYSEIDQQHIFYNYWEFLSEFSSKHSELGEYLIKKNRSIDGFLMTYIILGFINSKKSDGYKLKVLSLYSNKKIIISVSNSLDLIKKRKTQINVLNFILGEVKKKKNNKIALDIYIRLLNPKILYTKKQVDLYLRIIKLLSQKKNYSWTAYIYRQNFNKCIFNNFSKKDWKFFLHLYIKKPNLEFNDYPVFKILIDKYPILMIDFLLARVKYGAKKKVIEDYSAIPHSERELQECIKPIEADFIEKVFDLEKEVGFTRLAIHLHNLFPDLSGYLGTKFKNIIQLKDKVLWNKQVRPFFTWYETYQIEPFIEKTIRSFKKDEDIWQTCISHLLTPGSVSGSVSEPILANAIEKKLELIKKWRKSSKKIKEFITQLEKQAEQSINYYEIEHQRELLERKSKYNL